MRRNGLRPTVALKLSYQGVVALHLDRFLVSNFLLCKSAIWQKFSFFEIRTLEVTDWNITCSKIE
jgi:hypothetical protein